MERKVGSIAHEKSPKHKLGALKVAATYSPTTQCSTIGDAVCVGAAALSARLCRAPLRPPPPVPSLCALCLARAPLRH